MTGFLSITLWMAACSWSLLQTLYCHLM